MQDVNDVQAWILCMDLLIKVKNELIAEAIELLHSEIDAKRVSIEGSFMSMSDTESQAERDIFLIQNLLAQEHEIMQKYGSFLVKTHTKGEFDSDKIRSEEELRKFLMALNRISKLMRYSKVFDEWAKDASYEVKLKSQEEILEKTINLHDSSRKEALEFVLRDEELVKNEALSSQELKMLRSILAKR